VRLASAINTHSSAFSRHEEYSVSERVISVTDQLALCQLPFSTQYLVFNRNGDAEMKTFRDLRVWQKAHLLALRSYRTTSSFPKQDLYGLVMQIRRCATPIAANVAEGCGKRGNREFQRYLHIACGSGSELEYHFLLARDLGLVKDEEYKFRNSATIEVKRMLASLVAKIEADCLAAEC
jgi:four helix bundle protein